MKKTIIALLSSLMLAGAICAVSGASSIRENGMVVIMGDGTSPLPMSPPPPNEKTDTNLVNQ